MLNQESTKRLKHAKNLQEGKYTEHQRPCQSWCIVPDISLLNIAGLGAGLQDYGEDQRCTLTCMGLWYASRYA